MKDERRNEITRKTLGPLSHNLDPFVATDKILEARIGLKVM